MGVYATWRHFYYVCHHEAVPVKMNLSQGQITRANVRNAHFCNWPPQSSLCNLFMVIHLMISLFFSIKTYLKERTKEKNKK